MKKVIFIILLFLPSFIGFAKDNTDEKIIFQLSHYLDSYFKTIELKKKWKGVILLEDPFDGSQSYLIEDSVSESVRKEIRKMSDRSVIEVLKTNIYPNISSNDTIYIVDSQHFFQESISGQYKNTILKVVRSAEEHSENILYLSALGIKANHLLLAFSFTTKNSLILTLYLDMNKGFRISKTSLNEYGGGRSKYE